MSDRLLGGNTTPTVVRIDDTVHRSPSDRSPFVAELLTYLESVGFPHSPRWLGVDPDGRDVLQYIPGVTTDHPDQRASGAYAAGGRMLRLLHDATERTSLAGGSECVQHGDPGPFNTIFRRGLPVAFIDWDRARPGARLDDLGYLAWTWCIQATGDVPISDQADHLRELRNGYGDAVNPHDLLECITATQSQVIETATATLERGATSTQRDHARRTITWATSDRELVRTHRSALQASLER